MIALLPSTLNHATAMAPNLRDEDAAEGWLIGRKGPLDLIQESLRNSSYAMTALADGKPVAMWGWVPDGSFLAGTALIWMVGTPGINRIKKFFLVESRRQVAKALETYRMLWNHTDARYSKALRWAKWLGFEVGPALPLVGGGEVHRIEVHR